VKKLLPKLNKRKRLHSSAFTAEEWTITLGSSFHIPIANNVMSASWTHGTTSTENAFQEMVGFVVTLTILILATLLMLLVLNTNQISTNKDPMITLLGQLLLVVNAKLGLTPKMELPELYLLTQATLELKGSQTNLQRLVTLSPLMKAKITRSLSTTEVKVALSLS
jgi:hypothetical protein